MKKLILICSAVLMAAFLGSCSDDNATNPSEDNSNTPSFFEVGNWWKYDEYNGDTLTGEFRDYVSTWELQVVGKQVIDGKEAFVVVNTQDQDTSYFYANESGIYNYFPNDDSTGIKGWLNIIDFEKQNWDIFKIEINNEEDSVITKGTAGVKGAFVGESTVTYKGSTYTAKNYAEIFYNDMTITSFDVEGEEVTHRVQYADTVTYTLIPNIGFYSIVSNGKYFISNDGTWTITKATLVDHYVK